MYIKLYIIALTLCAIFLASTKATYAQSLSVGIYPPVIEIQATPPSSPQATITIHNLEERDIILDIILIPFEPEPNGNVRLNPSKATDGFYPYYKDRIQFLVEGKKTDSLSVEAGQLKEIVLNINLAKGDPPTDIYYSIIFLASGTSLNDTNITQLPAGIATNLLLSVGPKGQASGGIAEFSGKKFIAQGPMLFNLKLHNAGKHLIQPVGTVEVENILGKKVAKINILPQYILAGEDRYLIDQEQSSPSALLNNEIGRLMTDNPVVIWPEKFLFGRYKATATLALSATGPSLTKTYTFYAFPLYAFVTLAITIFIILSIYLRVKKII